MLLTEYDKNDNNSKNIWKYKKILFGIPLFLMFLQIIMLEAYGPSEADGWFSDIAYHLNIELNGWMAKDIPYGQAWSSGVGKLFFFIHNIFYNVFGAGLFQARMVTVISGILLLLSVFLWTYKFISKEIAILSTFILAISPLFYASLYEVRYMAILSLFSFLSFYFLSSGILNNKNMYFLLAGFFSSMSVDINYRGVEIVLAVYLLHLIYFERELFLKRFVFLFAGSLIAFVYWFSVNIVPVGIDNFIKYTIIPAAGDGGSYTIKTLLSEFRRVINNLSGKRILLGVEVLYLTYLLVCFYKYRAGYNKISKIIISWILVVFVVLSLLERTIYPSYLLMYYPLICILSAIGLRELFKHKEKLAYFIVFFIIVFALFFQGGRFALYGYHAYFKGDFDLKGYYEKLRAAVDINKNIIGTTNHWYAFPDAQYYGGQFYLGRVKDVLKELKSAEEYDTDDERAAALLRVFEKRKIEYIIADECLKPTISRYFPNKELPPKNFMLVSTIMDMFLGKGESKSPPYKTEIYKVISYEP